MIAAFRRVLATTVSLTMSELLNSVVVAYTAIVLMERSSSSPHSVS